MNGVVIVVRNEATILVRDDRSWRLPMNKEEAGLDDGCNIQEQNGLLFWDRKISSFDMPFANLWGQGRIDLFTKRSILKKDAIPEEVKKILLGALGD